MGSLPNPTLRIIHVLMSSYIGRLFEILAKGRSLPPPYRWEFKRCGTITYRLFTPESEIFYATYPFCITAADYGRLDMHYMLIFESDPLELHPGHHPGRFNLSVSDMWDQTTTFTSGKFPQAATTYTSSSGSTAGFRPCVPPMHIPQPPVPPQL